MIVALIITAVLLSIISVFSKANTVRFLPFASENIDLSVWAYTWSNPLWLQALEVYTDWINWFIS